jgi:hypothetical protein
MLHLLLHLQSHLLPLLHTHLHYLQRVCDQLGFHVFVHLSVGIEAGQVIYLEEPGAQLRIQHDIEAEQVEDAVRFFRLRAPVQVLQLRLDREHGFNYYILDLLPDNLAVASHIRRFLVQRAPQDITQLELVLITIVSFVFFVQRVIG